MRKILLVIFAGVSVWAFSPSALVDDARAQIGVTLRYDPSYSRIDYPMGDVAAEKGVCSDVVVRALRVQRIDLQRLIHEDMRANFAAYPRRWGAKTTDRNIDHRRVLNIATYFTRKGYAVRDEFAAGDIVTWDLGGGLTHIGIVSDRRKGDTPLIIHNIGRGTQEEDILRKFKITGHFRIY